MYFDEQLFYYKASTLVDITPTKVFNVWSLDDRDTKRNQQRNWDTVSQIIGLRCQPLILEEPISNVVDIAEFMFGSDFTGKHRVWTFEFAVDRPDIFKSNAYNPTGALFLDFDNVPIITGLTETVKFDLPLLRCHSKQKNITFTELQKR